MASIDLKDFSFDKGIITSIRQLLPEIVFKASSFTELHAVHDGIRHMQEIGWIGGYNLVGTAAQGCNPVDDPYDVATRRLLWDPKEWGIYMSICAADLEPLLARITRPDGTNNNDLTSSDYVAAIVDQLSMDMEMMLWRMLWFSDVDAADIGGGGVLSPGTDPRYFNLLDGFWKQLFAAAPVGNRLRVEIPANAAATSAEQLDGLTGDMAFETLNAMWARTTHEGGLLRVQPDLIGYCTQSFADGYVRWLQGKDLETTLRNTLLGTSFLRFNGLDLHVLPVWDHIIAAHESDGVKLNNPHRVLFAPKSILGVGMPTADALDELKIFYDDKTEINHIRSKGKLDAKLLRDDLLVLGC